MDDEVIRKRLCVEGEGGSDDRRVLSLLKTFVRWAVDSALSLEERDATYQKMLFTLSQCEFSFTKTQLVMDMNRREMERYEEVYSEIGQEIKRSQQLIVQYKEELKKSRVIRKHRQEYDAMAKVIQQHPPRAQTEQRISELEVRLEELLSARSSLQEKLELRKRQFHVLLTSIHHLQSLLASEDTPDREGEEPVTMDTS
ncbi:THO complex subunit 7 homolog [Geodia barretti]|uniref:THO complex subunit 7 homolog n=1 Tax=Geodia barretti TaxID=519541 RepID=A0AA35RQW1_GEOBA|nr:THO complex subunit 7 homolog [Geodia barretti]